MKKILITLVAMLGMAVAAQATSYKVDDSAIDAVVENAVEVDALTMMTAPTPAPAAREYTKAGGKVVNPTTALILNIFLGGFGVHRHYMGTSSWMWALYTFTGGGIFGIVPLVDLIMIIMGMSDDSLGKYIDNKKFFMWA